jgi:SAM-dependent methyltransferase
MAADGRHSHPAEREPQKTHQRLQAEVWEEQAEILLDRIGVAPGWRCVDLGSGATGILASLARRVGSSGLVIGADVDSDVARAALEEARAANLPQVHLVVAGLTAPPFADASFDLVHLRFALHLVEPSAAVRSMARLARPGGVVAIQEPDLESWRYAPELPEWTSLLEALRRAIASSGDPDVGRALPSWMAESGLEGIQVRAVALRLGERHPHMRLPLAWAAAQRRTIVELALAREEDLDGWIEALEHHLDRPDVTMVTPTTVQAWGWLPTS